MSRRREIRWPRARDYFWTPELQRFKCSRSAGRCTDMLSSRSVLALLELPGMGRKTVSQFMRINPHELNTAAELREAMNAASRDMPRIQVPSLTVLTDAV